jgi:hypothetical protein
MKEEWKYLDQDFKLSNLGRIKKRKDKTDFFKLFKPTYAKKIGYVFKSQKKLIILHIELAILFMNYDRSSKKIIIHLNKKRRNNNINNLKIISVSQHKSILPKESTRRKKRNQKKYSHQQFDFDI